LLGSFTSGYVLTSLLSAVHCEERRRCQPVGQGGEGLPTGTANATSYPDAIVPVITGMTKPLPVAYDRVLSAHRAPPREKV